MDKTQIALRDAPYVFISYAHIDRQLVQPYVTRLEKHGLSLWWDETITPGFGWIEEIADAIVESSVFLLFVTRGVVESEYCFREVAFAQDEGIRTVVAFLESVRLPNRLRFVLSSIHTVSDATLDCKRLADTLGRALVDSRSQERRAPRPANSFEGATKRLVRSRADWTPVDFDRFAELREDFDLCSEKTVRDWS